MSNKEAPLAGKFMELTKEFTQLPTESTARIADYQSFLSQCGLLFRELLKCAEEEGPEAWFAIGHAYSHGWGPARDRFAGQAWFRRAADEGHSRSMVRLANSLSRTPTEGEQEEAIEWLEKAAALGDASGMVFLGFAYREGKGVPLDSEQAAAYFIKAFEAGDSHAAVYVGKLFAHQLKNPALGVEWLLRAAEAKCSDSYLYLALLYDDRDSALYDPAAAVRWYQTTADDPKGYGKRALLELARHYRDGAGVEPDRERALQFLDRLDQIPRMPTEIAKDAQKLRQEITTHLL